jgi:ribosomal protein L20
MDCAYQCWCSSKRFVLQPYDRWLEKAQVIIDRRVLADIAMHDAVAFAALAEKAKGALAA